MQSNPKERLSARGFTLLEVLLASAVFALSGFVLAQAFDNGQNALLNWDERGNFEKIRDWAVEQIEWDSLDLKALEQGGDLTSAEGYSVEWVAEVYPTNVLDLFHVSVRLEISDRGRFLYESTFSELRTGEWYEPREREELLEEKTRRFEQIRKERRRL